MSDFSPSAPADGLGSPAVRLAARYRDPEFAAALADVTWNEAIDTMLAHRSVRTYSARPLPPGTIETIVAAAQSAPTSSNLQAWSVIAVRDPARKARLSAMAAGQRHVAAAPLLLVFIADVARLRAIGHRRGHAGKGLDYLEGFMLAFADACFAAQNAVVALESLGLGCCYIGAIRNKAEAVAEELGLPHGAFALFGMTIGYPDPAVATDVKPRLAQNVILHYERYAPAAPEALASYDERMRDFRAGQRQTDIDWTEQAARRVKDEAALTGRHVLREILQSRGFGLR